MQHSFVEAAHLLNLDGVDAKDVVNMPELRDLLDDVIIKGLILQAEMLGGKLLAGSHGTRLVHVVLRGLADQEVVVGAASAVAAARFRLGPEILFFLLFVFLRRLLFIVFLHQLLAVLRLLSHNEVSAFVVAQVLTIVALLRRFEQSFHRRIGCLVDIETAEVRQLLVRAAVAIASAVNSDGQVSTLVVRESIALRDQHIHQVVVRVGRVSLGNDVAILLRLLGDVHRHVAILCLDKAEWLLANSSVRLLLRETDVLRVDPQRPRMRSRNHTNNGGEKFHINGIL